MTGIPRRVIRTSHSIWRRYSIVFRHKSLDFSPPDGPKTEHQLAGFRAFLGCSASADLTWPPTLLL
ncbi:MAG: hypothetical protein MI923_25365 [Phycisphaerales bacterium]|nr:hypothetical protein [Phycisphaerales bacterium]